MAVLDIRLYGDPVLRVRAEEVEEVDEDLRRLATDMTETMKAAQGVGLAANQVGERRRIIVIDLEPIDGTEETVALVNPEITAREGKMTSEEGCLSIPEVHEPVERDERVRVTYLDVEGETQEIEGQGLLAAVLQHEIDHLDGILITDHISPTRRTMLRATLKRIARQAARQA